MQRLHVCVCPVCREHAATNRQVLDVLCTMLQLSADEKVTTRSY